MLIFKHFRPDSQDTPIINNAQCLGVTIILLASVAEKSKKLLSQLTDDFSYFNLFAV